MELINKELDKNNRCNICESKIDNDIIIEKSLICDICYENVSNLSVNDFDYDLYKDKIKGYLSKKYKFK